MKVKELMKILSEYHPDEPVLISDPTGRSMSVTGADVKRSQDYECCYITTAYVTKKKTEEEREKEIAVQRQQIVELFGLDLDEKRKRKGNKNHNKKRRKRKLTTLDWIERGYLPTGKRGGRMKIKDDEVSKQLVAELLASHEAGKAIRRQDVVALAKERGVLPSPE